MQEAKETQPMLTVRGVNNNNETVKFVVPTKQISMLVMGFAPCMNDTDMTSEPQMICSVTLYLKTNLMACFELKILATEQQILEKYADEFLCRSLNLHAMGWVVSKVYF